MPNCAPSSSITRTWRARIWSLTRTRSSFFSLAMGRVSYRPPTGRTNRHNKPRGHITSRPKQKKRQRHLTFVAEYSWTHFTSICSQPSRQARRPPQGEEKPSFFAVEPAVTVSTISKCSKNCPRQSNNHCEQHFPLKIRLKRQAIPPLFPSASHKT